MDCHIIFYLAKKTSLCEKALISSLKELNIYPKEILFATTPLNLGERTVDAFKKTNLIFIVGGISPNDPVGVENILSNALAQDNPQEVKKLKNNISNNDGYIISKDCQLMVVLPDEPKEIINIFTDDFINYLKNFTEE